MFTPIFLHFILMVFSVVLMAIDCRDQCIDSNANGVEPYTALPFYNITCIESRVFTWNTTVIWNDGAHSKFFGTTHQDYNRGKLRGAHIGIVTAGRFKGSEATISSFLSDKSNGCESGNGVSLYYGNTYISINNGSCGPNTWIYCSGIGTINFNPPITQNGIPFTIGTNHNTFAKCFGSCL